MFWCLLLLGALSQPAAVRGADGPYSLVINGSIYDVKALKDLSTGPLLSAELLTIVARADGHISVATRPDRGLVVLSTPTTGGAIAPIQGFKTASLTVLVNQDPPTTVRGRLVGGVPFVDALTLQTLLERLGFNVLIEHESLLITVFRTPAGRGEATDVPAVHPPGAGMLEAVQRGAFESLQRMGAVTGVDGSSSPGVAATPGSMAGKPTGSGGGAAASGGTSSQVCQAMDTLRALWDQTEPSAREKTALRELAQKFQTARDNGGKLEGSDLDLLVSTLRGFQQKVSRRVDGTRAWSGPQETREVQRRGNSFLDTIAEAVSLSVEMADAMQRNDRSFVNRAGELIQRLQTLEGFAQEQGMRFNEEVLRVRSVHGCGPATLGLPPT